MQLLSQVKLLDFRLISKYECIIPWQLRCYNLWSHFFTVTFQLHIPLAD